MMEDARVCQETPQLPRQLVRDFVHGHSRKNKVLWLATYLCSTSRTTMGVPERKQQALPWEQVGQLSSHLTEVSPRMLAAG